MTKRNPLVGKHTLIMAAMTKALSGGAMKDFQNDMTETTRDAIIDAATKNLNRLMAGKSLPKSVKTTKTETVAKKAKTSKKSDADDIEDISDMSEKKTSRKAKPAKAAAAKTTAKGGNEKRLAKFEKIVLGMADAVSRIREKSDDADQIKKGVRRQFKNVGAEAKSITRNGSATVEFDGQEYRVRFQAKGPSVRHLGAAE